MTTINLDHAASAPPRPEATVAFLDAQARVGGNPAAGHAGGRSARTVLEESRERVADALGRSPHEVVFASGGTEADQLAVVGVYRAAAEQGRRHLVVSGVEHPAVADAARWLAANEGAELSWVAPRGTAPIAAEDVLSAVRADTALVAVTAADGEVGVRQELGLAEVVAARGVPCHLDAVQALVTGPVSSTGSLAISGHKLGAPVGIGAAVLPRGVPVRPLLDGPGQERGLRSGTQPAALAAALAVALELAVAEHEDHAARCGRLTSELAGRVLAGLDGVRLSAALDAPWRLPSHLHLQLDGVDGESLAAALDAAGVMASTGTACATGSSRPSPVLESYGIVADATLRLSVGRTTTDDEVFDAAARLVEVVGALRASGGGFLTARDTAGVGS